MDLKKVQHLQIIMDSITNTKMEYLDLIGQITELQYLGKELVMQTRTVFFLDAEIL